VPSHAWNVWRYHYPQGPFPYQELIEASAARDRRQPEYELLDAGAFDGGRYWIVEVAYAKAGPDDLLMAVSVANAGPDEQTLHVLPTSWFCWLSVGWAMNICSAARVKLPASASATKYRRCRSSIPCGAPAVASTAMA